MSKRPSLERANSSDDPRELDYRIGAEATVRSYQTTAQATITACALPSPDDTRRLLALQEALGDLAAVLSRGHSSDVSREYAVIGAIAAEGLVACVRAEACRPVVESGWTP